MFYLLKSFFFKKNQGANRNSFILLISCLWYCVYLAHKVTISFSSLEENNSIWFSPTLLNSKLCYPMHVFLNLWWSVMTLQSMDFFPSYYYWRCRILTCCTVVGSIVTISRFLVAFFSWCWGYPRGVSPERTNPPRHMRAHKQVA